MRVRRGNAQLSGGTRQLHLDEARKESKQALENAAMWTERSHRCFRSRRSVVVS